MSGEITAETREYDDVLPKRTGVWVLTGLGHDHEGDGWQTAMTEDAQEETARC